jgi:CheY-like chemotaxis protein
MMDGQPGKTLRILLVEDHVDTQLFMSRLLQSFKHEVTAVGTVREALTLAGDNAFDLVISDLGLPDGTGFALMQELRDTHGLKGIALSGYGEDFSKGQSSGFLAHLVKPIDFNELRQAIGKVTREG